MTLEGPPRPESPSTSFDPSYIELKKDCLKPKQIAVIIQNPELINTFTALILSDARPTKSGRRISSVRDINLRTFELPDPGADIWAAFFIEYVPPKTMRPVAALMSNDGTIYRTIKHWSRDGEAKGQSLGEEIGFILGHKPSSARPNFLRRPSYAQLFPHHVQDSGDHNDDQPQPHLGQAGPDVGED